MWRYHCWEHAYEIWAKLNYQWLPNQPMNEASFSSLNLSSFSLTFYEVRVKPLLSLTSRASSSIQKKKRQKKDNAFKWFDK